MSQPSFSSWCPNRRYEAGNCDDEWYSSHQLFPPSQVRSSSAPELPLNTDNCLTLLFNFYLGNSFPVFLKADFKIVRSGWKIDEEPRPIGDCCQNRFTFLAEYCYGHLRKIFPPLV